MAKKRTRRTRQEVPPKTSQAPDPEFDVTCEYGTIGQDEPFFEQRLIKVKNGKRAREELLHLELIYEKYDWYSLKLFRSIKPIMQVRRGIASKRSVRDFEEEAKQRNKEQPNEIEL